MGQHCADVTNVGGGGGIFTASPVLSSMLCLQQLFSQSFTDVLVSGFLTRRSAERNVFLQNLVKAKGLFGTRFYEAWNQFWG